MHGRALVGMHIRRHAAHVVTELATDDTVVGLRDCGS
jgi:hypothetical protein